MAAELEKLAQIAEASGLETGAKIIRANTEVMLNNGLIPPQLDKSPEIKKLTNFREVGNELAVEGYYSGGILVRDLGKSLLSTGILFFSERLPSKSTNIRRRAGSSVDLIQLDGKVLRRLRAQASIRLIDLSANAGVTHSLISMIEHERYSGRLNRAVAEAIAKELGVSLDDITFKPQDVIE